MISESFFEWCFGSSIFFFFFFQIRPLLHHIKHKVIKDEKSGCEIKRYKRTERNDILITDFTSIKKLKLDFTQPVHNAVFQEISTVENELSLFDVVNVKGILYNIAVLETATKDDKIIEFKKASLKDNTGAMPITLYNMEQ